GQRRLLMSAARETVNKLANWLSEYMGTLAGEEKFRKDDTGHHQLLIADSISLCTIALKKDVASFLKGLTINIPTPNLDNACSCWRNSASLARRITGTTHITWLGRKARNMSIMRIGKRGNVGTDDRRILT